MPYARMRDGARLHHLDVGRGPVCMLPHGFAMPATLWLPFIAPLAAQYRFVLPNLRGFGGSHRLQLAKPRLLTRHADDVADLVGRSYLDTLRSYLEDSDYDWRPSLAKVRVPMTVVVGMRSRMYPAEGQLRIRDFVPHARIERIANTGHPIPFEAPVQFLRALRRFLRVERQAAA